jgi:hypothetical protein
MTTIQLDQTSTSALASHRRSIGVIAGLASLGLAALLAVQLTGSTDPAGTTASGAASEQVPASTVVAHDTAPVETVSGPVPEGMEVVGDEHGPRGYLRAFTDGGEPALLPLGSGEGVRGFEVVDSDGTLVGYMLEQVGFVDLVEAADAAYVDGLVADQAELAARNGG